MFHWSVLKYHVKLDGMMFDIVIYLPFAVTVVCVSSKAFVHPQISYDVVIHSVVKGGVFEFIGRGRTKNRIVFC